MPTDGRLDVGVLLVAAGLLLCCAVAVLAPTRAERHDGRHRSPSLVMAMAQGHAEHAGASIDWSPAQDVAAAILAQDDIDDLAATERAELADAAAALAPLITAEHDALGVAWRAFDAAIADAMRTAQIWHNADHAFCRTCNGQDGQIFGTLGTDREHTGIRAFRIDTPTGEYPLVATT
jgi:hypothetical protein